MARIGEVFLEDLLADYSVNEQRNRTSWSIDLVILLLDSILKDYPIGHFVFKKDGFKMTKILDGENRLYSLFSALMQPKYFPQEVISIYFDPKRMLFLEAHTKSSFELHRIYANSELFKILRENQNLSMEEVDSLRSLHDKLHKYRVPCYFTTDDSIEMLARINCLKL